MSASPRGKPLPSRELERRFGWGHLKDHESKCRDCDGTGRDGGPCAACAGRVWTSADIGRSADCPDCPDPCHTCDQSGRIRWGSFYVEDHGECSTCTTGGELPIAALYDGGHAYVCLRCYIRHHRTACGCALWSAADAHVPDARKPRARYRRPARALGWRLRRDGPDADAARAEVIAALESGGGVHARAAAIVGMRRDTFARLLARHGLSETARLIRTGERAP